MRAGGHGSLAFASVCKALGLTACPQHWKGISYDSQQERRHECVHVSVYVCVLTYTVLHGFREPCLSPCPRKDHHIAHHLLDSFELCLHHLHCLVLAGTHPQGSNRTRVKCLFGSQGHLIPEGHRVMPGARNASDVAAGYSASQGDALCRKCGALGSTLLHLLRGCAVCLRVSSPILPVDPLCHNGIHPASPICVADSFLAPGLGLGHDRIAVPLMCLSGGPGRVQVVRQQPQT